MTAFGSDEEGFRKERPLFVMAALAAIVAGAAAAQFAIGAWLVRRGAAPGETALALTGLLSLMAQHALLLGFTWTRLRFHLGVSLRAIGLFDLASLPKALRGIGGGFVLLGVNYAARFAMIAALVGFFGQERVLSLAQAESARVMPLLSPQQPSWAVAAGLFLILVSAPIAEELFFRGYAYNTFKAHWGPAPAAWASAVLFAAVHFYVLNFLPIAALGVLLAAMHERHGGVAVPIWAHGSMNALVALSAAAAGM